MTGHRIEWTHAADDVRAKIICDEPAHAFCHLYCEYCEEWNECADAPNCRQPCGYHEDDETCSECAHPKGRHCWNGHPLLPRSTCQIIDNFDMQDGAIEAYGGPEGVPVHDGPIKVWYDDGQFWEYTEVET